MIQRFKFKRSIKFKLLMMTAFLILFSVFLVSFLSYLQYIKDYEVQSRDGVQQIIEQVSLNIDTYLDDLSRLSVSPYWNDRVMNALSSGQQDSEIEQLFKTRLIENFLDEIMIIPRNDILTVIVMADQIYASGRIQTNIDTSVNPQVFDWYQQALTTQDSFFVPAHRQQIVKNSNKTVFSIVKQLRDKNDTEKIIGVIKVDANYNGIEDICNRVDLGQDGGLFIMDGERNIIFSNMKGQVEQSMYTMVMENEQSSLQANLDNNTYLMNTTQIERANWTIVALTSVAELNYKATQIRNMAFLMAIMSSFLGILVLFFFIKRFLKPLLTIVKLMREIDHGNLNVTFPDHRNDEIGYLGSSFNEMVFKINEMLIRNTTLIKEVYEAKFLQKEAQINALYNQIRPHFIFNTLNMISMLVQSGRSDEAVDHINKLSSIMRNMASWDKEVTLKQEISLLHAYLSIQSSRFNGRLEYEIDIDPEWEECYIPALLLQPAVENAVIHGCEKKKGKTTIRIYSKTEKNQLLLCIEDNGKGMKSETLERLQRQMDTLAHHDEDAVLERGHGLGLGLINVTKRIKIKYGPAYGIRIHSVHDKGTCVTIVLPNLKMYRRESHTDDV